MFLARNVWTQKHGESRIFSSKSIQQISFVKLQQYLMKGCTSVRTSHYKFNPLQVYTQRKRPNLIIGPGGSYQIVCVCRCVSVCESVWQQYIWNNTCAYPLLISCYRYSELFFLLLSSIVSPPPLLHEASQSTSRQFFFHVYKV